MLRDWHECIEKIKKNKNNELRLINESIATLLDSESIHHRDIRVNDRSYSIYRIRK